MTTSTSSLKSFRFPVLVADIGGTNARFAIVRDAHALTQTFEPVSTAGFPGFAEAATASVFNHTALMPRTAVIAVAGPVTGETIPLTNADWVIDPKELIARFDLESVIMLNDFEAQALALPGLDGTTIEQLGGGAPVPFGAKVVLGPGTGLGAAAMIHAANTWIPVPGEGGHMELGPVDAEDMRIWQHLERVGGRVGAEQVLSGSGLVRLSRAVAEAEGQSRRFESGAAVTEAADAGDEVAVQTVACFVRALGRVAGDLALAFLARGGVYLGGGIPMRIERHLRAPAFRAAFEAKAPHDALMRTIPTYLVRHPNPALEGLASFARTPALFAVELTGRRWSAPEASAR